MLIQILPSISTFFLFWEKFPKSVCSKLYKAIVLSGMKGNNTMKNEEYKEGKDIRRDYFKELINDVSQITTIKCDKGMDEKTPTTVILGKGTPLKDCSFKATDSQKYEDLFIATFVDDLIRMKFPAYSWNISR